VRPGLVPRNKYNPDGFSMDARNILYFVVGSPGSNGILEYTPGMVFWIFCGLTVFDKLRLSDVWEIVKLCM
jgi:hypothetical protein